MNFPQMQEIAIEDLTRYKEFSVSVNKDDRQRAAVTKAALHMLPEREQDILKQFFIERDKRYAGHRARLQAKYDLCLSDLYRLKNQAITNYCISALALKMSAGRTE